MAPAILNGGLGGKGDHQTEDNARKRNTRFDAGHWNTQDAQSATERHHYGEDQRQNPDRRRAKEKRPTVPPLPSPQRDQARLADARNH